MMLEATKGHGSPIMIEGKDREWSSASPMLVLAVIIILVIFIFVIFAIFALKRDHHRDGNLTEMAALGLAMNHAKDGGAYQYQMLHDNMRDNLREFGEVKKEIMGNRYEAAKEIAEVKFEGYKCTKESEEKVLMAIKDSEIKRQSDELAREREANLYHRIVATLHPHHHRPLLGNSFVNNEMAVGAAY